MTFTRPYTVRATHRSVRNPGRTLRPYALFFVLTPKLALPSLVTTARSCGAVLGRAPRRGHARLARASRGY